MSPPVRGGLDAVYGFGWRPAPWRTSASSVFWPWKDDAWSLQVQERPW